ncbi:MAG TPA: NADH-quinone oxidoreductase subunit C [Thermoleophilia bacterium]|nr:NADH-quinone oxidoreductase subunit C [Thermoleophilia bacterium]
METRQESVEIPEASKVVFAKLEEEFGGKLLGSSFFRGELTFTVSVDDYVAVATFCRDSPDLAFERLDCLLGNHYPERLEAPFEVVLHLTSVSRNSRLRLKVSLAEGQKIPTVSGLWRSADWDERETWEMYGIVFQGHPNLIRLLLTDDFEGYPLRKDFPVKGTVGGRIRTDLKGKI